MLIEHESQHLEMLFKEIEDIRELEQLAEEKINRFLGALSLDKLMEEEKRLNERIQLILSYYSDGVFHPRYSRFGLRLGAIRRAIKENY